MAPQTPLARRKSAGAELAIAWLGLFGLIAVIALVAFTVARDREDVVDATEDRAQIEAVILADHAARLLEAADIALSTVIDDTSGMDMAAIAASRRLHDRFRRLADRLPYVEAFWFHGPDGQLVTSSLAFPAPSQNAANNDFHAVHLAPNPPRVYVGPPVGDTFRLSRRIDDARGNFRGVASLTIESSFFRAFYAQLSLPAGSVVTLLNALTLAPLAQHPGDPGIAPVIHAPQRLRESIAKNPEAGTFRGKVTVDQVEPVYAYRKVPDFPLYIKVSVPLKALNREWIERVRTRLGTALGAITALGLLTWLGFRQAARQREFQEALATRVAERTMQLEQAIHEVHHRVNNNLQIVGTLLTAQLAQVRDRSVREALAEGVGRVNTIGLAHQVMYASGSVADLTFGDYLRAVAGQMKDLYGAAAGTIEVCGENPTLPLEAAVPLALIVHEVLAVGVHDGRRARVDIKHDGNRCNLVISGVSPPPGGSMASRIISLLAKQLGAEVRTEATGSVVIAWKPTKEHGS